MKTEVPETQGVKQKEKVVRQRFNIYMRSDIRKAGSEMATRRDISLSRQVERLLAREITVFNRSGKRVK